MNLFTTKFINSQHLPLVVEPTNFEMSKEDFYAMLEENREFFRKQLLKCGGLLFRGFPTDTVDEFVGTLEALNLGNSVDYIGGGAPRVKVKGGVYTSTEAPPGIKIHLHNEMSFTPKYPDHIYFYCETPPEKGGETFIGDARKIYDDIDPKIREKFVNNGLKYISRYYHKSMIMDLMNKIQRGHKTWIDVFDTSEKNEVEKKCKENQIGYQWLPNDWLQLNRVRPAVMEHPETKENIWFNQVHLFDYNPRFIGWLRYIGMKMFYCRKDTLVDEIRYADDSKISRKDIYHVHDVLDKNSIYFPWQKGDIMVLDNILTMHGRAPFSGKRRVLTAMTKAGV